MPVRELNRLVLEVLYQDDYLVAVDKPSGWDVHRGGVAGKGAQRPVVLQALRDQLGKAVHTVHRLDGGTSGVLLFALDKDSQRLLNASFESRQVKKSYVALVRGFARDGSCADSLRVGNAIQDAFTTFKCLAQIELPWPNEKYAQSRYSLVEAIPETGRYHQIRRHLNHLGWPVVGDTAHGDGSHNRLWREHVAVDRLMLHAASIAFQHPFGGWLEIKSNLPEVFQRAMALPGWSCVGESARFSEITAKFPIISRGRDSLSRLVL
ncbi:MAG: tRNA pseudouridine synthase [Pseudomonadota bacterium]